MEKMKREELKTKGFTDDQIDWLMDENGKDINKVRSQYEAKVEQLTKDNEVLKTSNTELDTKYKAQSESYKDYEELKKFKEDSEAKVLKQQQIDWLKAQGCKHPDLFLSMVDWNAEGVSYDNDKKVYLGLDDKLKGFKETYSDMFDKKGTQDVNPGAGRVAIGQNGDDLERYKQEHPEYF